MTKLFGLPVGSVLVVLVAALGITLGGPRRPRARNRVFFRLGVRNARRRPARTALIVAGSMLGTTIIAAALATGDTMSQTIRSTAVAALGRADVVVAARGVDAPLSPESTGATGARYFPQAYADRIARAARRLRPRRRGRPGDRRADRGAGRDRRARTSRASRCSRAAPASLRPSGRYRAARGRCRSLTCAPARSTSMPRPHPSLDARAGDTLRILVGRTTAVVRVRSVVRLPRQRYGRRGTADAARSGAAPARQAGPDQAALRRESRRRRARPSA